VTEGLLPAVERSLGEETATVVGTRGQELRKPTVERSSGEGTSAMQIDDGQDPRTLGPFGTRDQRMPPSDGRLGAVLRTTVVEWSSGEETVTSSMRVGLRPSVEADPATSSMLPVERPSGEVYATDIATGSHAAIGAQLSVDRASTDALETDGALTEPMTRIEVSFRISGLDGDQI
jgi:hypothetical protein